MQTPVVPTSGPRFDRLFDDLEAQADAAEREELAAEVADRTRREVARVGLADRIRAAAGSTLEVRTLGGWVLAGRVEQVGAEWLLLALDRGSAWDRGTALIRTETVTEMAGLAASSAPTVGEVDRRQDVGHPLRALARDRSSVAIALTDGRLLDGRIARVGLDFIDLAVRGPSPTGSQCRTISTAAVAVVRY